MRASLHRILAAAALATTAAVALSSCSASSPEPTTVPTEATTTATPTPTPTATTPAGESTPVTIGCNDLVPPQVMYDFNPNFVLRATFTPDAGSQAEQIRDRDGLACEWENQSSGETIVVAVAQLGQAELDSLKNNLVMSSNAVPTYGDEGYFEVIDGRGEAEVFSADYWIVATSPAFFEPGDAATIVGQAISALP